jgi:hypothetical protein
MKKGRSYQNVGCGNNYDSAISEILCRLVQKAARSKYLFRISSLYYLLYLPAVLTKNISANVSENLF